MEDVTTPGTINQSTTSNVSSAKKKKSFANNNSVPVARDVAMCLRGGKQANKPGTDAVADKDGQADKRKATTVLEGCEEPQIKKRNIIEIDVKVKSRTEICVGSS